MSNKPKSNFDKLFSEFNSVDNHNSSDPFGFNQKEPEAVVEDSVEEPVFINEVDKGDPLVLDKQREAIKSRGARREQATQAAEAYAKNVIAARSEKEAERNRSNEEIAAGLDVSAISREEYIQNMAGSIGAIRADSIYDEATQRKLKEDIEENNRYLDSVRERTAGELTQDTLLGLSKAVVGVGQMAYGLADLATMAVDKTFGQSTRALAEFISTGTIYDDNGNVKQNISAPNNLDALVGLSQNFKETQEFLNKNQSSKLNSQRQLIQEASQKRKEERQARYRNGEESWWDTVKEESVEAYEAVGDWVNNPSALVDASVESSLSMLVPGSVVKNTMGKNAGVLLTKKQLNDPKLLKKQSEAIAAGTIGIMEGTSNYVDVRAEVIGTNFDTLYSQSPLFKDLVDNQGMSQEMAREAVANNAALSTAAMSASIGTISSKFSGAAKLEGNLFRSGKASASLANAPIKAVVGGTKEAVEEGVQSGVGGQLAQNISKKLFVDEDQDITEGVGSAAGAGIATGAGTGGTFAGAGGVLDASGKASVNKITKILNNKKTKDDVVSGKSVKELNDEDESYSPSKAVDILLDGSILGHEKYTKPEAFAAHSAEVSKHMANWSDSIADRYEDYDNLSAKEQKSLDKEADAFFEREKQVNKLVELRSKKGDDVEVQSILEEITTSKEQVAPEKVDEIIQVLGSNPDSFTKEELTKLSKSDKLSEEDKEFVKTVQKGEQAVQALFREGSSGSKTAKQVFYGGGGNIGVLTHKNNIMTNLRVGNVEAARKSYKQLTNFRKSHANKAKLLEATYDAVRSGASNATKLQAKVKKEYGLNVHKDSGNLVQAVRKESDAINATVDQMRVTTQRLAPLLKKKGIGIKEGVKSAVEAIKPETTKVGKTKNEKADAVLREQAQVNEPTNFKDEARKFEEASNKSAQESKPATQHTPNTLKLLAQAFRKKPSKQAHQKLVKGFNRAVETSVTAKIFTPREGVALKNELNKAETLNQANKVIDKYDNAFKAGLKKARAKAAHDSKQIRKAAKTAITEVIEKAPNTSESVKENQNLIIKGFDLMVSKVKTSSNDPYRAVNSVRDIGTGVEKAIKGEALSKSEQSNKDIRAGYLLVQKATKQYSLKDSLNKTPVNKLVEFNTPNLEAFTVADFLELENLESLKISDEDKEGLRALTPYITTLLRNLEYVTGNSTDTFSKYLGAIDGTPIKNLQNILALEGLEWLASMGSTTVNQTDKDIEESLSKFPSSLNRQELRKALRENGSTASSTYLNIGRNVLSKLKAKAKDDAPVDYMNRLAIKVGQDVVAAMAQSDLVEVTTVSIKTNTKTNHKKESNAVDGTAAIPFLKMKEAEAKPIIEAVKTYDGFYQRVLGSKRSRLNPSFSPQKTSNEIRRTEQLAPKQAVENANKHNQKPAKFKDGMMDMLELFNDDELVLLNGGINDLNTVDASQREGAKAKRNSILQKIKDVKAFKEKAGDKVFYFTNVFWQNMRMGVASTINMQASKFERHVMNYKEWEQEVPVNDNVSRMLFFKAVATNLGLDHDKYTDEKLLDDGLIAEVINNPKIKQAAQDIRALRETPDLGTVAQKQLKKRAKASIDAALNQNKDNGDSINTKYTIAGLDALHALSYYEADKPFVSHIGLEVDGITNGPAIGLMQYPIGLSKQEMIEKLNRVGIYLPNQPMTDFTEWSEMPGNLDSYESFANTLETITGAIQRGGSLEAGLSEKPSKKAIANFELDTFNSIKTLLGNPTSLLSDEEGDFVEVDSEGRDFGKDPVMKGVYGQGPAAMARELGMKAVNKLIAKAYSELNKEGGVLSDSSREKLLEVNAILKTKQSGFTQKQINQLNTNNNTESIKDFQLSGPQLEALDAIFEEQLGSVLQEAVQREQPNIVNARNVLNEMSLFNFTVYRTLYEKARKKTQKGKTLTVGEKREIEEKLKAFKSVHLTPLSEDSSHGVALSSEGTKTNAGKISSSRYGNPIKNVKGVEGKEIKSLSASTPTPTLEGPGSKTTVMQVHSSDGTGQNKLMGQGHTFLNVHDANMAGVTSIGELSVDANQVFLDMHEGFSSFEQTYNQYQKNLEVAKQVGILDKDVASTMFTETFNYRYTENNNYDLEQLDVVVKGTYEEIKRGRAELYNMLNEEGTSIGQFGLNGFTYLPNATENSAESVDVTVAAENAYSEVSELAKTISDTLGSNPDSSTTFNPIITRDIDSTNSNKLLRALNKLDGNNLSPEHKEDLQAILDGLVNKTLQPLKVAIEKTSEGTWGSYHDKNVRLSLGDPSKTLMGQSFSETYVHELVHSITKYAINKTAKGTNELKRLFAIAEKHITVADLHGPNPTQKELRDAERMYDYVFRNKNSQVSKGVDANTGLVKEVSVNSYLHEFLALGLTNPQFKKALQKPEIAEDFSKKYQRKETSENQEGLGKWLDNTVVNTLRDLFLQFVNYLSDRLKGTEGLQGDEVLMTLATQIAEIDTEAVNNIQRTVEVVQKLNTYTGKALNYAIGKPLVLIGKKVRAGKEKLNGFEAIASLLGRLPNISSAGAYQTLKEVTDNYQKSKDSVLSSLAQEMAGITPNTRHWHVLLRLSNLLVDQTRKQVKTSTKRMLNNAYTGPLDRETKKALTHVLLQTDAFNLFGSMNDILEMNTSDLEEHLQKSRHSTTTELLAFKRLLKDPANIASEIARIEGIITGKYQNNANFYIKYGSALGKSMTTGLIYEPNQHDNAYQVANLFSAPYLRQEGSLEEAEGLIQKLATLHALNETEVKDRGLVLDALESELAVEGKSEYENGLVFTLQMAALHRKDSTDKLFNGDRTSVKAGYVRETFDPHTDIQIAPVANEEEMNTMGYKLVDKLPTDPAVPQDVPMAVYQSKHAGQQTYMQSIVSMTGMRKRGTSLLNARINAGEVDTSNALAAAGNDFRNVKTRYYNVARMNANKRTQSDGIYMLKPVYNNVGDITDYRYVMSDEHKRTILNRNDAFDDVLAATRSNLEDKVNTETINTAVVNTAKSVFDDEYATNPGAFINVGPNSTDPELVEMWAQLPDDMKQYVNDVFGSDGMYVKRAHYNLIFGFRKLSISQAGKALDKRVVSSGMKAAARFLDKTLNRKGVRLTENLIMDLATMAKDTIVIKTGAVFVGNEISNTIHLLLEGIPRKFLVREKIEGYKLATQYQEDRDRLDEILIKLSSDKLISTNERKKLELEKARVENSISTNPIIELVNAGVYQTIVEDVDLEEDEYGYLNQLEDLTQPYLDKIPKTVKDIGNSLFITHDTKLYKTLRNGTQMSDFVARYVLHKWNVENKGMDSKDSLDHIVESYINYDVPTNAGLQYANDLGLVMFTKYFLRIQKVMARQFRQNPFNVLSLLTLQGMFDTDTPDIYDTFMPTANIGARFYDPWENFQTVFQIHAAEFSVQP